MCNIFPVPVICYTLKMVQYFINFWVWWYVVKAYDYARNLIGYWSFLLNYVYLPSMIANLFVPLYQDNSIAGKFISVIIRFAWIVFTSVFMIFITVPMLVVYLIYLLIPFLPIFALLGSFIKWF